jgi:hypothetical protein
MQSPVSAWNSNPSQFLGCANGMRAVAVIPPTQDKGVPPHLHRLPRTPSKRWKKQFTPEFLCRTQREKMEFQSPSGKGVAQMSGDLSGLLLSTFLYPNTLKANSSRVFPCMPLH